MKKLIFLGLLLISTTAYAGQVICYDTVTGRITGYGSGGPTNGCLYYSLPPNTQAEYDTVANLFKTVPRKYILVDSGSPREMTALEKSTYDTEYAVAVSELIRMEAKAAIDGQSSEPLVKRCTAKILVDEINTLRTWTRDFKTATAGASTLSAFKIAVAALPTLNNRTLAQAKTAIDTCVDDGSADE